MTKPKMYNVIKEPITWLWVSRNFEGLSDACLLSVGVLAVAEGIFGAGLYPAEVVLFGMFLSAGVCSYMSGVFDRYEKIKIVLAKRAERINPMDTCDNEYD